MERLIDRSVSKQHREPHPYPTPFSDHSERKWLQRCSSFLPPKNHGRPTRQKFDALRRDLRRKIAQIKPVRCISRLGPWDMHQNGFCSSCRLSHSSSPIMREPVRNDWSSHRDCKWHLPLCAGNLIACIYCLPLQQIVCLAERAAGPHSRIETEKFRSGDYG